VPGCWLGYSLSYSTRLFTSRPWASSPLERCGSRLAVGRKLGSHGHFDLAALLDSGYRQRQTRLRYGHMLCQEIIAHRRGTRITTSALASASRSHRTQPIRHGQRATVLSAREQRENNHHRTESVQDPPFVPEQIVSSITRQGVAALMELVVRTWVSVCHEEGL
jgi:hypothetical protein